MRRRARRAFRSAATLTLLALRLDAAAPVEARHGMVVSQSAIASQVGVDTLQQGGSAVDAAVATAFALAVTHPAAGNIGGGGFLVYRPATGEAVAYDFRETAPAAATATMFLRDGQYDPDRHHKGHLSVGVPGTVAGLHMAWSDAGKLPWRRLLAPAIELARDGFVVSPALASELAEFLPEMKDHPAAVAQFSREGHAYVAGERLRQPELAATLARIAEAGPAGFYAGETAELIEREMRAHAGLITRADLADYRPHKRPPLRGSYRGLEVIAMPPPSGAGVILLEALNVLEGYDIGRLGFGSAAAVHLVAEALRRGWADRVRYLGDPDQNAEMPVERLISKPYAADLRATIRTDRASVSVPSRFEWAAEGSDTTHVSVVDAERGAVALTYTLEDSYGSKIVVPGAGFLLNNEMGDFNAGPGLTTADGLLGTPPNLAGPGKRMLSSMAPTLLVRDGGTFLVLGSPGGRKIPSVVLETILNVVDFGMNVQQAVDAPRFHHQWLPDLILHEKWGLSPDTLALLAARGHRLSDAWPRLSPTNVEVVLVDAQSGMLAAGCDRRGPDAAAIGY